MSAAITLPASLRSRLAAVRRRARLLRAVRGLGWVVVVLGLSGAAVGLADYAFDLPAEARQMILPAWLGAGALLLLGVVVPLLRRLDAAALAAVIEEKYPDLGERLTSAVELAGVPPEGHGSPVLIALLMDETERHTSALDFRPAVPARRTGLVATLAAIVVLLVAAPAVVWPATYGELARRFFRPWDVPPVVAPFTIEVSPGETITARGRDVTLSARLTPRDEQVTLPASATLVVVSEDGKETRQAMGRTDEGAFSLALKVRGDVAYRVEAGEVVSEAYRITAVTPVELAADSPAVTLTPPAYARKVRDEETFQGLVDLSPLRHSRVRFDFRFTRPAVAARLEWTTADGTTEDPLTLSEDRRTGHFTTEATAEGKYRVVLEAEHGIRTELPGGTMQVRPDQPPVVVKLAGEESLRAVLPYERLPMELVAADDVGVAGVELEYQVNDREAVRQRLELQGADTPSAVARGVLELAGKVREDDRVRYRFRVSDNLPKEYEGPHVTVYPADRWLMLRVMRKGDPLRQKEILAQRDEINRRLESIRQALLQERRGVYKVQQESRDQASLAPEHTERLKQLQQDNRDSENALREVARTAEASPALHPITELARDVADREMHASQKALEQAPRQATPPLRRQQFVEADRQLDSAVKRLDELKKTNDRLAQERLDRAKLEELAQREKRLAEEAADLAAKHPVLDPTVKPQAEKVQREQTEVAAELERMAQQSEPLRKALEAARAEEARRVAEHARELAEAQRELARAEAETERQRNTEQLAELARKQQELAEEEEKLARQTRPAVETARSRPLQPEESRRAAEALRRGDAPEAIRHQEQAASDLERLARDFERAVKTSADPKEAARQLAQAEKALRQRVQEEAGKKDDPRPAAERLKPLQAEQNAIRQAAQRLSVPPAHAEVNRLQRQIAQRAAEVADAMQKQDALRAQARMQETQNLLNRLADVLPGLEQRRQQARQEAERLRRRQDEIARQVEQLRKDDPGAARRLAEAARQQADVAEALSKMDAPNQEERRERTAEAATRALADLMDARREDVPASQQEAKRRLERLGQALRGEKPADERARDLAHRQRQLTDEAARAGADPKEIQRRQREIAEQTANLQAPEAPQRQREAGQATRQAADAPTPQHREEAARKLDELARQMAGQESDAARAERLARRQAEEAAEAARRGEKGAAPEAQRRQQDIAREAQAIRSGDEAREEKRRAVEALARAEQAPPREQARARREAADALHDLADRLAARNDPAAKANDLARRQRELAAEATRDGPRQAADRQAELKRQLDRLDTRDALQAAKETGERMTEAARALEGEKPADGARDAIARAAAAAEKLADQLGKAQATRKPGEPAGRTTSAKPPAESPRQATEQMARQQRQLAQATQQAQGAGAEASRRELPKIAEQQRDLSRQASQLPAAGAQRGLEQARAAMNRAEQALARRDAGAARQEQAEAASALERLARQLPDETPQAARRESPDVPEAAPRGLPAKEQGEEARVLARRQRELREAVLRATQAARAGRPILPENPVGDLARQQDEVARQAADLARNVDQEQGDKSPVAGLARQARQSAEQAARRMQAGAIPQAREAGQQTAGQLRDLASRLAQTPRRGDPQAPDPLEQARQLGRQQEEINRRLEPLVGDARAREAQQQARQQELQRQAGELARQLGRMTAEARSSWPMQSALQRATGLTQQAEQAMRQAREQARQGASAPQQQSEQRAAQMLDQAAQQARQASAQAGAPKSSPETAGKTGEAVAQAREKMGQAAGQLRQGQPSRAQAAMQQAAQALTQAARQMATPPQPGRPEQTAGGGRLPGGLPDLTAYGLPKAPDARSWGELPGELRTKIVQDMKARYGEDYARAIKYYFEQIADTKKD